MSNERRKRETRTGIEETFTRYQDEEEPPQLSRVEDEEPTPKIERPTPGPSVVPTRIPGLDPRIGGGLPNASLILVVGTIDSNYTTFVQQVLHNRLTEKGKVAYYTTENSSTDIETEMESYNWSLKGFLPTNQWIFVDVLTPDLQKLAELAPENFNKLRINLTASLNSLKTDLLDKIKEGRWTALHLNHLLHNYDLKEVMDLIMYWKTVIRIYGGIHFALLPSGIHPDTAVNTLKYLADGALDFQIREGIRDYEGSFVIQKLRGLRTAKRIQFGVSDEGLTVETAERIG